MSDDDGNNNTAVLPDGYAPAYRPMPTEEGEAFGNAPIADAEALALAAEAAA